MLSSGHMVARMMGQQAERSNFVPLDRKWRPTPPHGAPRIPLMLYCWVNFDHEFGRVGAQNPYLRLFDGRPIGISTFCPFQASRYQFLLRRSQARTRLILASSFTRGPAPTSDCALNTTPKQTSPPFRTEQVMGNLRENVNVTSKRRLLYYLTSNYRSRTLRNIPQCL